MINVIALLGPLLGPGRWEIGNDGRINPAKRVLSPDKPFRSANLIKHGYDCSWEMDVLFEVVYRMKLVPIRCLSCYKVLLKPTTLADVYRIEAFQQAGDYPCKVGMEIRPTVKRPWGAYWYTNSIEEGRERFREVRDWAKHGLFDDWKILLKRGCTEYEQAVGPSDAWEQEAGQVAIEAAVHHGVNHEPLVADQPPSIVENLHEQWEKWEEIMKPYVTYHEKQEDIRRRKQMEERG